MELQNKTVVIDGIKCKLVKTNPMVVTVANGQKN